MTFRRLAIVLEDMLALFSRSASVQCGDNQRDNGDHQRNTSPSQRSSCLSSRPVRFHPDIDLVHRLDSPLAGYASANNSATCTKVVGSVMARSSFPAGSSLPLSDAPHTLLHVIGAVFLTLVTGGAIFGAGVLCFFCSF